jgi:hypothetical protein
VEDDPTRNEARGQACVASALLRELDRHEGSETMAYYVTCNNWLCGKEIVVGGPPPKGIEEHIICSECQENMRAESDAAALRDSLRESIGLLEADQLPLVDKLIMHQRGLKKDPGFTSLGIPYVSDRVRKRRTKEREQQLLQEALGQMDRTEERLRQLKRQEAMESESESPDEDGDSLDEGPF